MIGCFQSFFPHQKSNIIQICWHELIGFLTAKFVNEFCGQPNVCANMLMWKWQRGITLCFICIHVFKQLVETDENRTARVQPWNRHSKWLCNRKQRAHKWKVCRHQRLHQRAISKKPGAKRPLVFKRKMGFEMQIWSISTVTCSEHSNSCCWNESFQETHSICISCQSQLVAMALLSLSASWKVSAHMNT